MFARYICLNMLIGRVYVYLKTVKSYLFYDLKYGKINCKLRIFICVPVRKVTGVKDT